MSGYEAAIIMLALGAVIIEHLPWAARKVAEAVYVFNQVKDGKWEAADGTSVR